MKKSISYIIIPIASVLVCALLMLSPLDLKVADMFQRPLKSTTESPEVLMIAIDDDAVDQIGTWPFSRTVYSQMLANLKELGASSVVFDLSFLDHSQASVDESYVKDSLPGYVDDYFSLLTSTASEYMEAISDGDASYDEAMDYYDAESRRYAQELNNAISHVISPVDEILAASIKDFGNTFLTLTFEDGIIPSDEENNFILTRSFTNLISSDLVIYKNVLNKETNETYKVGTTTIPYYKFNDENKIRNEKLVPMAEGLFYKEKYLYILFENSSDAYFYAYQKLAKIIKYKYK